MPQPTQFDAHSILAQMDEYAKDFRFPTLDNAHWELGDTRLTAFRNDTEWLIIFEIVNFTNRAYYQFLIDVYGYGNLLSKPGWQTNDVVFFGTNDKLFEEDEYGHLLIDLYDFTIELWGEERRFTFSEQDYVAAGVTTDLVMEKEAKMLRILCANLPGQFFLSDQELLDAIERPKLDCFLKLDDWWHPHIADDERPSENPFMISLANALAQGDPDLYHCPPARYNTHWSNWPDPPPYGAPE